MNRISRIASLLLLILGLGATACYQPVDLSTDEEVRVPWVHCVLSPVGTQWLEFRMVSQNGESRGINEAEISLYMRYGEEGDAWSKLILQGQFENVGDGLWKIDDLLIESSHSYTLKIQSPGLEDIWAHTTMPSYDYQIVGSDTLIRHHYLPGLEMETEHHSDVEIAIVPDETYIIEYEVNGKTRTSQTCAIVGDKAVLCRYDHPHYLIPGNVSEYPLWVYKVGWSEAGQSWFIEDALTCNLEDRADGFNSLGIPFTKSREPAMRTAFPETEGRMLHYRYLRFPRRSLSAIDSLAISGDFSGPHYGDAWPAEAFDWEKTMQLFYSVHGVTYDHFLTNGHAGYVNFKSVSDEYDRYLKDVAERELLREVSSDVVGIYNNTNTYTNIQNGTGIFGAEVNSKLYWSCGVWIYE